MYISKHFIQVPSSLLQISKSHPTSKQHTQNLTFSKTWTSFLQATDLVESGEASLGRFPKGAEGRALLQMRPLPPKGIHHTLLGDRARRGMKSAPHTPLSSLYILGETPRWRVSAFLQTGVCPSVELSPPELAFFHWTKCRKKEERPRKDARGEGVGSTTAPPLLQLSLRAKHFHF